MELMTKVKIFVFSVVALLAIIVFFQNSDEVLTKILFAEIIMPRSVLLIFTLLLGFVLGMVASAFLRRRKPKVKATD